MSNLYIGAYGPGVRDNDEKQTEDAMVILFHTRILRSVLRFSEYVFSNYVAQSSIQIGPLAYWCRHRSCLARVFNSHGEKTSTRID